MDLTNGIIEGVRGIAIIAKIENRVLSNSNIIINKTNNIKI